MIEKKLMVDKVAFGETVHAPPSFKSLPRGAEKKTSGKFSSLLLLEKLKVPEHKVDTKKQEMEDERQRVIDAYRTLKGTHKL